MSAVAIVILAIAAIVYWGKKWRRGIDEWVVEFGTADEYGLGSERGGGLGGGMWKGNKDMK